MGRWRPGGALPAGAPPDGTVLAVVGAALFALYAATAQRVVGFADSAGFAASCLNADIAHAPGYPLYALLCHPFSYLPVDAPAFAASLFSAACAAAAAVVLARVLYALCGDAVTAVGAAVLFGVSQTFWSQATLPEVYALNALLFLLALLLALRWRERPSVLMMAGVVLVSGLALSNHWPLFLLAAPALLPLLARQWRWLARHVARPRVAALWAAALAVGLLPYVYLLWRAHHPAAFMRLPFAPADVAGLWQIVSRAVFVPAIDNPAGSGAADQISYALFFVRQAIVEEITLLGGGLLLAGAVLQWRQLGAAASAALLLLFAGTAAALLLLVRFLHDAAGEQTFAPYLLLPYAAGCCWAALAARRLFGRWRGVALAVVCAAALAVNYPANDRSRDTLAADIADVYLDALPPGAFFPLPPLYALLSYRQYTTGAGEEVRLLPPPTPYLAYTITPGEKLYPPNTLSFDEEMAIVDAYAAANPLCYNTFIPFAAATPSREWLLFSCLREAEESAVAVDERVTGFLRGLAGRVADSGDWQARRLGGGILYDATRALMLVRARGAGLPPDWAPLLEELSTTPHGQLAVMEYLVRQPALLLSAERAALFADAAERNLPRLTRRRQARMLSALADCFAAVAPRAADSLAAARDYHAAAAALLPAAHAPAVQAAYRFYLREGLEEDAAALLERYGEALLTADVKSVEE